MINIGHSFHTCVMIVISHFVPLQDEARHIVGPVGIARLGPGRLLPAPTHLMQLLHGQAHQVGMAKPFVAQVAHLRRLETCLVSLRHLQRNLTLARITSMLLNHVLHAVQVSHQSPPHAWSCPSKHGSVLRRGAQHHQTVAHQLMLVRHIPHWHTPFPLFFPHPFPSPCSFCPCCCAPGRRGGLEGV